MSHAKSDPAVENYSGSDAESNHSASDRRSESGRSNSDRSASPAGYSAPQHQQIKALREAILHKQPVVVGTTSSVPIDQWTLFYRGSNGSGYVRQMLSSVWGLDYCFRAGASISRKLPRPI